MVAPVFVTDDVPTADQVNDWMVNTHYAIKTADESVTSSTTLQDDNHLSLPVDANASYEMRMGLLYDGDANAGGGDLKINLVGPGGSAFYGGIVQLDSTATLRSSVDLWAIALSFAQAIGTIGTGQTLWVTFSGVLVVGGAAGNFTLQWAQNAPSSVATRVFTGSHLILRQVA